MLKKLFKDQMKITNILNIYNNIGHKEFEYINYRILKEDFFKNIDLLIVKIGCEGGDFSYCKYLMESINYLKEKNKFKSYVFIEENINETGYLLSLLGDKIYFSDICYLYGYSNDFIKFDFKNILEKINIETFEINENLILNEDEDKDIKNFDTLSINKDLNLEEKIKENLLLNKNLFWESIKLNRKNILNIDEVKNQFENNILTPDFILKNKLIDGIKNYHEKFQKNNLLIKENLHIKDLKKGQINNSNLYLSKFFNLVKLMK